MQNSEYLFHGTQKPKKLYCELGKQSWNITCKFYLNPLLDFCLRIPEAAWAAQIPGGPLHITTAFLGWKQCRSAEEEEGVSRISKQAEDSSEGWQIQVGSKGRVWHPGYVPKTQQGIGVIMRLVGTAPNTGHHPVMGTDWDLGGPASNSWVLGGAVQARTWELALPREKPEALHCPAQGQVSE